SAKYDRIIIDTAPTQAVSDSLIVSTHSDAIVYVVKADSTHIKNIKSGIGRLLQIGANVAGVVLNQVDLDQSAKYGDYEGYYDQYGYNETSQQVEDSQQREDIPKP
ncbi:MAG: chain-length determining protein, partial [Gammaproteobacteria bacterium]